MRTLGVLKCINTWLLLTRSKRRKRNLFQWKNGMRCQLGVFWQKQRSTTSRWFGLKQVKQYESQKVSVEQILSQTGEVSTSMQMIRLRCTHCYCSIEVRKLRKPWFFFVFASSTFVSRMCISVLFTLSRSIRRNGFSTSFAKSWKLKQFSHRSKSPSHPIQLTHWQNLVAM